MRGCGGSAVMQRMCSGGLKRVRYFSGQVLSAADFRDEQQYWLERQRRHNRLLHGWGIVTGLAVTVNGNTVTVAPGLALDPVGREVDVSVPLDVAVTAGGAPQWVVLSYCERDADPLPSLDGEAPEPSRIEEGASLTLEATVPADSVAIGRLTPGVQGWIIDGAFLPRPLSR